MPVVDLLLTYSVADCLRMYDRLKGAAKALDLKHSMLAITEKRESHLNCTVELRRLLYELARGRNKQTKQENKESKQNKQAKQVSKPKKQDAKHANKQAN